MIGPRSRWLTAAVTTLLALGLIHACEEQPTEPQRIDARNASIKYPLAILATGSTLGGVVTSSRGGINCTITYSASGVTLTGTCGKNYRAGMVLTVTAAPSGGGTAVWSGCDGGVTENPLACQVTMSTARTITIKFSPPPSSLALALLGGSGGNGTVQSSPSGINCTITGGSAGSTGCSTTYGSGTAVTLTATAASGSYVKAWAGGGCDTNGTGIGQGTGSCTLTMSQAQSIVVSFQNDAAESIVGAWGAPMPWQGGVAIHSQLLPDGVVMTWGRMEHAPVLWDPNTGGFRSAARPADVFCSGHAFLPDGRLLVTGGHSGTDNLGIRTAYLYDFASNTWARGPDMRNGRWYPSTTTLADGQLLTMSGGDTAQQKNLIPEVFQPGGPTGTWRVLSTASKDLPLYPWPFVGPDGRVFVAGPSRATYYLDPSGTGTWVNGPSSNFGSRDYGSAVMYDAGKILLIGGGGTPTATAEVIDLNAGSWRTIASMSVARRQLSATLLADGKVLVTGGTNASGFNTLPTSSAVLAGELWDPATERWTTLSRMSHNRLYHSTSLLLLDGRVLSVGSGQPAASGLSNDYTAEIFSPPYLFQADGSPAARPNLDDVPQSVAYGQTITVRTADPTGIFKATWIRLSSTTHSFNQNQRMNNLVITARGTETITLQMPANANLAPPGHYMLFLVRSGGTPSVGKIVRIN